MSNETDTDTIVKALRNMRRWHEQGRSMPGYRRGEGVSYLAEILQITRDRPGTSLARKIDQHYPNLWVNLAGPHGWTIYKMLMIRKGGDACAGSESTTTASCP